MALYEMDQIRKKRDKDYSEPNLSTEDDQLTRAAGRPPRVEEALNNSFSSPETGTPWTSRTATSFLPPENPPFSVNDCQPLVPQEASRTRGSSFSDRFNLDRLFRGGKHKPKRIKAEKDKTTKSPQPDIPDKKQTSKFNRFWGITDSDESEVSSPHTVALPQFFASPHSFISPQPLLLPRTVQPPQTVGSLQNTSGLDSPPRLPRNLPDVLESPLETLTEELSSIAEHPSTWTNCGRRILAMDTSRLAPESVDGAKKQRAVQDAKDMYQAVLRNCERTNTPIPPFDFFELIGKGGSGRVYKCRDKATGNLVAIKIISVDDVDYLADTLDKDDTIRDFRKEVKILNQLKDSQAKNVNMIHDAFDLQQQLWIVCDYCTGGSVRTLMRARPPGHPGLEEKFIIPIARELAVAMKSVHNLGIIHRDIKCTNVYITETGEIQLGDFGIVGIMDDGNSKRRTVIGTPHYMPREMHESGPSNQTYQGYGQEVDIWSFGCTVYEMATGAPPNPNTHPNTLIRALANAPRLEGGDHSVELRDFVAFCLNSDPQQRPTSDAVLKHPYIADTHKKYPTSGVIEMIANYKLWEYGGGFRSSLFMPGGAAAPAPSDEGYPVAAEGDDFDDWNFSTSDGFNQALGKRFSQMVSMQRPDGFPTQTHAGSGLPPLNTRDLTPMEKVQEVHKELSANRGERSLERLFNDSTAPYELHTPTEDLGRAFIDDLPLRNAAPTRESTVMIDLDTVLDLETNVPAISFDFGDTIKARNSRQPSRDDEDEDDFQYVQSDEDREKRATLDWKFPSQNQRPATMEWSFPKREPKEPEDADGMMELPPAGDGGELPPAFRPALKHTTTEPVGQFRDFVHPAHLPPPTLSASPIRDSMRSMIDLDFGLADPSEIVRPSTATSATGSTMTDMTSGNPFDLEEDPDQNEVDRDRFSYHKQWQSEGGQVSRSSRRSVPMHTRGSSLSSTESDLDHHPDTTEEDEIFGYDYGRKLSDTMRRQINGTTLANHEMPDMDQWPNFGGEAVFDRIPGYADDDSETMGLGLSTATTFEPPLARLLNGDSSSSRPGTSRVRGQPEIEFPRLEPPNSSALLEDADPRVVMAELDRLLDDFHDGLRVISKALRQHSGLQSEDGGGLEESDGGLESSAPTTGDEEGF